MRVMKRGRTLAAGLVVGALIGTGVAAVTPAGAAVKSAAASIDWKVVWKTEIKPRAKKTFYTKKASNQRYYTKAAANGLFETKAAHDASLAGALGNYYTKAQSDANYYTKAQSDANYYTKAQSDAKYAPIQKVFRGSIEIIGTAAAAGGAFSTSISFGATFSAAPTVHIIGVGAPTPAGCAGTVTAPDAAPGNLCIFESFVAGPVGTRNTCPGATAICAGTADPWGAGYYYLSTAAGLTQVFGTWAARPVAIANPSFAPSISKGQQGIR